MEKEYKPTTFDLQTQSHDLQIIKAMIPYLDSRRQRFFAMFVKYQELQRTMKSFPENAMSIQSLENVNPQERMRQMIADISDQCNSHERENIDMLLSMFQILSTCDIGTENS